MKTKDFEKLIKMMGQIIDMKHEMQSKSEEDEDDDECDSCGSSCIDCPIEKALKQEYMDMMDWAFGKNFRGDSKGRTIEIWKILHPDLEIPRMLHSTCEDSVSNTLGMLIDVVPLYREHKRKEKK